MEININKTFIGFFIFLLITLSSSTIVVSSEKKYKKFDNMKQGKENIIFDSVETLSHYADLIILGKIIKIEKESDKIEYVVVSIREVYKGWCTPVVVIEKLDKNRLDLQIGSDGIFFLSTENKKIYQILKKKYAFLIITDITDTMNLYCENLFIGFKEYILHLKEVITFLPKSEEEQKQEKAVDEAKRKVIQLGYELSNMIIDIDENNTAWNKYIIGGQFYKNNPKMRENLKNRNYWAIYFGTKGIDSHDGDLWVFIERKTFEVILTIPQLCRSAAFENKERGQTSNLESN